jgi:hypothetical protein
MKTLAILLFTLFFTSSFFGQFKRGSYTQFNLSVPFRGNPNYDEDNDYSYWFLPDGLSAKFGGGIHYNKKLSVGMNTGLDWIATEKLVVIPVFGNLKLSTKIGPEDQLFLQAGYGRSIVLGRGNLTGDYKKIGIGFEDTIEGLGVFVDITQYGFTLYSDEKVWSISLGVSFTTYKNRIKYPNPTSSP